MAKRSKPSGGWSPGKVIAIGILSVFLLVVIVAQFGGRKERVAAPSATPVAAAESAESPAVAADTPLETESKRVESTWPAFNVTEIVASNPFVLPEVLRPRREAVTTLTSGLEPGEPEANLAVVELAGSREMRRRQAEFMTSLRAKGVDMILRSPRGSVARIGELSLRVGDVHEGLRVEAIGQNGVVFAPAVADGQPD